MTTIATTMETQICKIALRKLTQRLAIYGVSNSMPIVRRLGGVKRNPTSTGMVFKTKLLKAA